MRRVKSFSLAGRNPGYFFRPKSPDRLINRKSNVLPLEGDIATKINKTIIYLVRLRKGEERLGLIGRIEDALLTIEAQSLW